MKYIDVIPSQGTVKYADSLNVLGGVANDSPKKALAGISVWGRVGSAWVQMMTQNYEIDAGEHKHLYFTIPEKCFIDEYWGEELEEMELVISDRKPDDSKQGILIFVER